MTARVGSLPALPPLDEPAFDALAQRHRRELHVHCYRRDGDWRLVPTTANRMPTAASYLRRPGDTEFRAFKFDVLRIEGGAIAEITTFGPSLFPLFELPARL
jgi:hypothetical protein